MVTGTQLGGVLLGVVIVTAIVVGFATTILGGFNEFSEDDACSDAGCSFGNPAGFCAINSSSEGSGITCDSEVRESLPLGILFTLVLGIIFAAAVFIAIKKIIIQ